MDMHFTTVAPDPDLLGAFRRLVRVSERPWKTQRTNYTQDFRGACGCMATSLRV